jgi:hypothetical protein
MTGPIHITVKTNKIAYEFTLNRKFTVIAGDSGIGKTALMSLLEIYKRQGIDSGIKIKSKYELIVVNSLDGLEHILSNSIVLIDEWVCSKFNSRCIKIMQESDNFFVFITRKITEELPISVKEVYTFEMRNKVNSLVPLFKQTLPDKTIRDPQPFRPELVIVEGSGADYDMYLMLCGNNKGKCISAGGKSNVIKLAEDPNLMLLKKLVIVDGAAFGSNMASLLLCENVFVYAPESFELLLLRTKMLRSIKEVDDVLNNIYHYIDTSYNSWEQFFTALIVKVTRGEPFRYTKNRLNNCYTCRCCTKTKPCELRKYASNDKLGEIKNMIKGVDFSVLRG